MSTDVPSYAVACGAKVIEKHFTLSRKLKGPDHFYALEPKEFKQMVKDQRNGNNFKLQNIKKKNLLKKKVFIKYLHSKNYSHKNIKKNET